MESFENKIEEIDELLLKFRSKWQLDSIVWMDFQDVCQIIRIHLYNKWHLWDQERNFRPWCAQVIRNQMINLVRDHHTRFVRPCLRCDHNLGENSCDLTPSKIQCAQCPLYAKWEKKKEPAFRIRNAGCLDNINEFTSLEHVPEIDYDLARERLHQKVCEKIDLPHHREIYKLLYIENWTDDAVAKKFGLKPDPTKRATVRYKQILNLKKKFEEIARKVIQECDIV
jgi:RNA polymerase sigma factor (sigma-70 family)